MAIRVLIAGGKHFTDCAQLRAALDALLVNEGGPARSAPTAEVAERQSYGGIRRNSM